MMKSILIIEDDITFGMMLKTWLGKKGFEVSSVSNIARSRWYRSSEVDERKGNRYTFDYYDRLCRYPIGSAGYETGST